MQLPKKQVYSADKPIIFKLEFVQKKMKPNILADLHI